MMIYAITLPETPHRTVRLITHLQEMGMKAKLIQGIHAKNFGLLTSKTYEYDHPNEGYHIPSKHVGLFLSHYICWNLIASSESDFGIVLEDDVLFESNPTAQFIAISNYMIGNGYDMVYLGSGNTFDKPKKEIAHTLFEVQYPQCTHAYMLTKQAANRLLLEQRECYAPIDLALIHKSLPNMKILTVLPRLASQHGQEIMP